MPLIIIPLIYIFYIKFKFIKKKFIFGFILVLSIFSFLSSFSSDISKTLNTAGTIHNRLWLDDNWREELLLSGYPKFSHDLWLKHGIRDLGVPPDQAVVNLPEYKKWWEDQYLNKPYVDYSFINIEYRNKGYGKRLYKAASLCLKLKYGLKLYASGNQSKEAKNLWQSLKKENDPYFIITGEYLEAKIKS
jgi:hypothetical protein